MRKSMAASTSSSSTSVSGSSSSITDGSAKSMVVDQISESVQSTSNLLHLMLQSSPAQAHLLKLPNDLLAKTSTIKNTEQVLEQLPRVISSLDAHMDSGLQSLTHLQTVVQLLTNIESCQLKSLPKVPLSQQETEPGEIHSEAKAKPAGSLKTTSP